MEKGSFNFWYYFEQTIATTKKFSTVQRANESKGQPKVRVKLYSEAGIVVAFGTRRI